MRPRILLPNALTATNLLVGLGSMLITLRACTDGAGGTRLVVAAWLIIAATVLDGLDGFAARWSRATSRFGAQFDSLADVTVFGTAPAILVFARFLRGLPAYYALAPALFLLAAAYRLARFNASAEGHGRESFVGMPITASGGMLAAWVLVASGLEGAAAATIPPAHIAVAMGLCLVNALLMASTIPFATFPRFFFRSLPRPLRMLVVCAIAPLLIAAPAPVLLGLGGLYCLESVLRGLLGIPRGGGGRDSVDPHEVECERGGLSRSG